MYFIHNNPLNIHLPFKVLAMMNWVPNDMSKACSVHFASTDYEPGLKIKRLEADAVPSVFPHYPKYMPAKVPRTLKHLNVQEHAPCLKKNKTNNV